MIHKRSSTAIRKKQIIDAAGKAIIRYGSEHVTVKRIATEIGISEAAIYKHFKSKKDVLSLLIDDIESTLLSAEELNITGGAKSLDGLEKIFTDHMSRIISRRGISFQVIAEIVSLGDRKLNKKVYLVIQKYTGRIAEILSQGIKTGTISPDVDLDAASMLFFCITQGLVNNWTLSQYSFDLTKEFTSLWNIFRKAVVKPQE